jgi:CBS domain-containing protein
MAERAPSVPNDATLDAVVEVFATEHVSWVPVLDDAHRVVGIVGTGDLIGAYRRSLGSSLQSLRSIFPASVLVEDAVGATSVVVGRTVADAGWPGGTAVVAIARGDQLIFPEPGTRIQAGDVLSVLVPVAAQDRLRAILADGTEG